MNQDKINIGQTGHRFFELPLVEPRKSTINFDKLIQHLSSCNTEKSGIYNDFAEMILCLANEIIELKIKIKALENEKNIPNNTDAK